MRTYLETNIRRVNNNQNRLLCTIIMILIAILVWVSLYHAKTRIKSDKTIEQLKVKHAAELKAKDSKIAEKDNRIRELESEIQICKDEKEAANIRINSLQETIESLSKLVTKFNEAAKIRSDRYTKNTVKNKALDDFYLINESELNNWIAKQAPKGSPFIGRAGSFLKASQQSGLDPKYIIAHAALESGWGMSKIAKAKGNYFGIGAYNKSPYASAKTFSRGGNPTDTFTKNIVESAIWIKKNYTDQGQNTLTKMIYGKKTYCVTDNGKPSDHWIREISKIMTTT